MGPKKNNQKMSIGDFLTDQSLGSWADEMDTQPMPAPSSGFGGERRAFSTAGGFGDSRGGGDRFGDRGGYQDRLGRGPREQLPLPTQPPYTAHLGNLSFEVTEGDVQNFLAGCDVTSIRIVEDKLDRRPKGFGYVEFGTLDGLKQALTLSETQFQGRNIRISVAEPPKDREGGRELNDWTRKGPLPELPGQGMRRASERGGGFRNFEPAGEGDRPGRKGFPPSEGDGKPRDFANWERKGPLSPVPPQEPRQGGRGSRDFGAPRERKLSPAWGEGRSDAGSRPPRREFSERPPPVERNPTAADLDNQWRSRMKPDAPSPTATPPETSVPSSPAAPPKPAERPRLNLQKRTVSEAPPADAASSGDNKASPFGAARPIDTSAREREVEEKRQLAIRQKREADDKAREEKKREAAAKAAQSPSDGAKDSAAPTPRENGSRKDSNAQSKDGATSPPGRQYEILRRAENNEEADTDSPDANMNGDIVDDKEVKPQEVKREVGNGNSGTWRRGSEQQQEDTTADQLEDDGFTVVASNKKGRGGRGPRALAS